MTVEEVKKQILPIRYEQAALEHIAQKYGLQFLILHGSYATAKARPDSDLDIAAVASEPRIFSSGLSLYGAITDLFENEKIHDIDFKLLNGTDPLFRYQVVRDGVLLYGNTTEYEEYKAVTYRMYEDAEPLRDLEALLVRRYQNHLRQYYA